MSEESARPASWEPPSPKMWGISQRVWWIMAPLLALGLYLGALLAYGISTQTPEPPTLPVSDKVTVFVQPLNIKPAEEQIPVRVSLSVPRDLYRSGDGLTAPLEITLPLEGKVLKFPKGSRVAAQEVTLAANTSTYEQYPLDRYETQVIAEASKIVSGKPVDLPTEVVVWGKFPGWHVDPSTSEQPLHGTGADDPQIQALASEPTTAVARLEVRRAGSTMGIVVLLLASMIVLAILAMAVARAVATKRRRVEATMTGWFAAMLFAIVPLRTNMPGSPPIGVWIDFLFFLWVALLLMCGLAIFTMSWLRYTPLPTYAPAHLREAEEARTQSGSSPPG